MRSASFIAEYPFERRVDLWTSEALKSGVREFGELLRVLPGVYPSAVLASLRRLSKAGELSSEPYSRLHAEATDKSKRLPFNAELPPPHPLNFEWRFTPTSSLRLLAMANEFCNPDGEVFLLGTPSVARAALELDLPQRVRFLGEDNLVTRSLGRESIRLGWPITMQLCGSPIAAETADLIVIDPPWYEDYISVMLRTATVACKLGGRILFSLAPIGCSRSTIDDRDHIFEYGRGLGLKMEAVRTAFLRYETPYFEANALRAAGLAAFPSWRSADLAVFIKEENIMNDADSRSLNDGGWREAAIGRLRLFVGARGHADSAAKALLAPLVAGDVLPSVSRRDSRRAIANVWTSGNRIFRSGAPDKVLEAARIAAEMLDAPVENEPQRAINQFDPVIRLAYTLLACARLEEAEERGLFAEERICEADSNSNHCSAESAMMRFG